MNPFGIIHAVIASVEGIARAASPTREKETLKQRWGFQLLYWSLIGLGVAVAIWVAWSLYFAK